MCADGVGVNDCAVSCTVLGSDVKMVRAREATLPLSLFEA